jgi:hypothetical protein
MQAMPKLGSSVKVNDLVEMSIIKQRSSQSPVDMILKGQIIYPGEHVFNQLGWEKNPNPLSE